MALGHASWSCSNPELEEVQNQAPNPKGQRILIPLVENPEPDSGFKEVLDHPDPHDVGGNTKSIQAQGGKAYKKYSCHGADYFDPDPAGAGRKKKLATAEQPTLASSQTSPLW